MIEYLDKNGCVCLRIGRKITISKQRYLYQQYHNCVLTNKDAVIFLDGNNRNFDINNLYKITRGELVLLNRWYKISSDPNETLSYIALIRLKQKRVEIAEKNGLTNKNGAIISDKRESEKRFYRNHPEKREANNKRAAEWLKKKNSDPVWRAEYLQKRRDYYYRRKLNDK